MTTKELRAYIDRTLGNSIRCLLPSYWWKKLFGLVVDKVESAEHGINRLSKKIKEVESIQQESSVVVVEWDGMETTQSQHNKEAYASIKTCLENGKNIVVEVLLNAIHTANVHYVAESFNIRKELDGTYLAWIRVVIASSGSVSESRERYYFFTLSEDGTLKVSKVENIYDEIMSDSSTNAPQNKAVKEYVDNAVANGGGSYDDSELRNQIAEQDAKLTELSARIVENEVLIEDLQNTKIEKENDDYYPKMAVGLADNLSGVDVVDSEINFRRSGGGAITDGVARIEAIKGNSVVWNQRWSLGVSQGVIDNTDGTTPKYDSLGFLPWYTNAINGHKILTIANDKEWIIDRVYWNDLVQSDVRGGTIYEANTDQIKGSSLTVRCPVGAVANYNITIVLYDLTQMFGAGNEPTTIEEFYSRIPMGVDKNAYNEGEVIHMDVQGVESVGVNAWDEEWELGNISNGNDIADLNRIRSKNYIRVFPNTKYYVKTFASTQFNLNMFDADKQYVGVLAKANSFSHTMPSNVHYVRFAIGASSTPVTTYKEGICINIDDTSINDKYYPYIKRVENLAVIRKYFPNGMRSAGSAHDEIRYNKESGKWEKVVRIGVVDMGSLNWAYDSANARFFTDGLRSIILNPTKNWGGDLLCNRYHGIEWDSEKDKFASVLNNGRIYVKDTYYTDIDSFIASIAGVMLYYELAEPIITELDEEDQFKDLDYQVWNAGTEKAIAEGKSSPLAADITYGFNAIGKIKELESVVAALRAKVGI